MIVCREAKDMNVSAIGNTYSYIYNYETKKLTTTDGWSYPDEVYYRVLKDYEDRLNQPLSELFDADAYRETLHSRNHSAIRESDSSDNGRAIGVATVGNIGYIARYADSSTPENPVIKIGNYEVLVNEVDPQNATQNAFYEKNQNWEEIMRAIKEVFLGNPQTYEQALNCDMLINIMSGEKKSGFIAEFGNYKEFHKAWMSQGAETPFSYTENSINWKHLELIHQDRLSLMKRHFIMIEKERLD